MKVVSCLAVIFFVILISWKGEARSLYPKRHHLTNARGSGTEGSGKVLGGTLAAPGQFPFHAGAHFLGGYYCGAVILDEDNALTAGHCCEGGVDGNAVMAGDLNHLVDDGTEQYVPMAWRIQHPNYNSFTASYDLCLIGLDGQFSFNEYVQAIPMPEYQEEFFGTGVLSGFGSTDNNEPHSDDLLWVALSIVDDDTCRNDYTYDVNDIKDEMMCAGDPGNGACGGDSGSPLTCTRTGEEDYESANRILCGTVSWGGWCGGPPTVFQQVSYSVDWIREHI